MARPPSQAPVPPGAVPLALAAGRGGAQTAHPAPLWVRAGLGAGTPMLPVPRGSRGAALCHPGAGDTEPGARCAGPGGGSVPSAWARTPGSGAQGAAPQGDAPWGPAGRNEPGPRAPPPCAWLAAEGPGAPARSPTGRPGPGAARRPPGLCLEVQWACPTGDTCQHVRGDARRRGPSRPAGRCAGAMLRVRAAFSGEAQRLSAQVQTDRRGDPAARPGTDDGEAARAACYGAAGMRREGPEAGGQGAACEGLARAIG